MAHTERVEFVDAAASTPAGDDVLDVGSGGGSGGPSRRRGLVVAAVVAVAVVVALLVGRAGGAGTPGNTVTASPTAGFVARPTTPVTTPVFGLVGLPRAIGSPRELVSTQVGDVVWMVDRGAGIVRIENGVVTATQLLESQATEIAVSPDGSRLYVATAASRPAIQVLDATTLTLGRSRPIDSAIQSMAVSIDAVWAASGSSLYRLDLDSLAPLSTLAMPGVVVTRHLRFGTEDTTGNQEILTGLVTGGVGNAATTTRFVRVDPLSERVTFGPVLPNDVETASAKFLTWVTSTPAAGGAPVTQGYATVLDPTPSAEATPPLTAGSRIYDGGSGFAAFVSVAPDSSVLTCHDDGGFATSEVDVAPAVPDAVITGQVLRTDTAFYVVTDRGLVRAGVGSCR